VGGDDARYAARQLEQAAADTRRLADRAVAASATSWQSPAAVGFRQRIAEEVERIRRAAGLLDDAAGAARRHAEDADLALARALRAVRGVLP
jgi:glycine cleavage system aminomethyltransferase T